MGGFWSGIYHKIFKSQPIKVFFGGLDAAGKTSILYRLKLGQTVPVVPTIGFNVEQIKVNKQITIVAWDVGGGCKIRKLFQHYYDDCKALIWIVDGSDRERILWLKEEFQAATYHQKLKDAVVLILVNKSDIAIMSREQVIQKLNLKKLDEQNKIWNIQSCCALTGEGLKEGIDWLGQQLKIKKEKH